MKNFRDTQSTQATFAALYSFSTHCLALRDLSLNVDIFTLPPVPLIGAHQ
jgi:hypothetical protein